MSIIDKANLMRPTSVNAVKKSAAVSRATSDPNRQPVAAGGKSLPAPEATGFLSDSQKQELAQAAREVSGYIQNITRELNFSVDEELDRTVITVIDEETGDVVRQIPTEEILEIAKSLAQIKDAPPKGLLFQGDA